MNRSSRGFTLLELLVVIALIGLLATIVLASLNSARARARDARRMADLNAIRQALELYENENGHYPNMFGGPGSTYCSAMTSAPAGWLPTNDIATIPVDPSWSGSMPYTYEFCQNYSGGSYDNQSYLLWASLERSSGNADPSWSGNYRPAGYNYVIGTFGPQ